MDEEKSNRIGEEIMCNIDGIIAKKGGKLTGHGLRLAVRASEDIYRAKEANSSSLEIFDKMAELCQILKEYASETKGEQQELLF